MALTNLPNNTLLQGGRYRVIRFISSGGFGCTYEAEHTLLERRVAIKEFFVKDYCNRDEHTAHISVGITSKTALVEKLKKKFIDEARSLSKLSHPGIVRVTDVFEENGTAYFVMDYIDGESISAIVSKEGRIDENRAVDYISQVCDALTHVHDQKSLHLDIKPGNIMVDKNGRAVLIDFGASKQYDEENGENTSTLMGKTPGYAPLEQMGNNVMKFTPATDIYALGATLYKMLTGITPPPSNLLAAGEELPTLPSHASEGVKSAVYAAMKIKKVERPQSVQEFKRIMLTNDDTEIGAPEPPIPGPEPIPQKRKFNKTPLILALLAIIIISSVIFEFIRKPTTTFEEVTDTVPELVEEPAANVENVTNKIFKESSGEDFSYTGEVVDGLPNGTGSGKYSFGSYTGQYKNGLMHGKGKFVESGGAKFEGEFDNDYYYKGRLTQSDGTYFDGTMKNGSPSKGIWYDKNGNKVKTL